ncbi:secreted protein, partial [Candidatus Thiomargarita nelsonii]
MKRKTITKTKTLVVLMTALLCGGLFSTSAHAIVDGVPASKAGPTTTGIVSLQMLYFGNWYHICGGALIS